MQFIISPELEEYMKKKRKTAISVEIASADHSDFEIAEMYLRLVDDETVRFLVEKKRGRVREASYGKVVLPAYRLHYDEVITFHLKRIWLFHKLIVDGIRM